MNAFFKLVTNLTILQAIIYFFIFIFYKKRDNALTLLGLYLITIVGPGLHQLLAVFNIYAKYEFPFNFYLLSPPLFYLYTKSVLGTIKPKDYFHLCLGIIEFIFNLLLFVNEEKLAYPYYKYYYLPNRFFLFTTVIPVFSVSYLIASYYQIYLFKKEMPNFYSINEQKKLQWINITILLSVFVYFVDTFCVIYTLLYGANLKLDTLLTLCIAFIVYWISLQGLHQRSLVIDYTVPLNFSDNDNRFNSIERSLFDEVNSNNDENISYQNTIIDDKLKTKYSEIVSFIEKTKIYKDKELNLYMLSSLLNCSVKDLSKTINTVSGKNFNQFINEFRISEAQRLMLQSEFNKFNLKWIADEVGFNSRSTFFALFKSIVGMTPAEFKNSKQM